jgi:hypothetical protein
LTILEKIGVANLTDFQESDWLEFDFEKEYDFMVYLLSAVYSGRKVF